MWRFLFAILLVSTAALAHADPAQFDIVTKTLPSGKVGTAYSTTIKLRGGEGPFEFRMTKGLYPPGLILHRHTGVIDGTPLEAGTFRFTVNVLDTSSRSSIDREFSITVQGPLTIEWVEPPKLTENTISGSVKVTNSSPRDNFDLTVIIVAVNESGKAFALGYQRFDLAQTVDQTIPFTSTVPNGRYIVHADAIAEVPTRQAIYRARLQTQSPLVVQVNR